MDFPHWFNRWLVKAQKKQAEVAVAYKNVAQEKKQYYGL